MLIGSNLWDMHRDSENGSNSYSLMFKIVDLACTPKLVENRATELGVAESSTLKDRATRTTAAVYAPSKDLIPIQMFPKNYELNNTPNTPILIF